jgi:hypothetical protein
MSGVIETTSLVTNSGCAPVTLPSPSVQPTSSENVESFSALLLEDNSAAITAQDAVGGTAAEAANDSKLVTTTYPIKPASAFQAETTYHSTANDEHGGAEKQVAKKPIINRLIDAVSMQDHSSWQ